MNYITTGVFQPGTTLENKLRREEFRTYIGLVHNNQGCVRTLKINNNRFMLICSLLKQFVESIKQMSTFLSFRVYIQKVLKQSFL